MTWSTWLLTSSRLLNWQICPRRISSGTRTSNWSLIAARYQREAQVRRMQADQTLKLRPCTAHSTIRQLGSSHLRDTEKLALSALVVLKMVLRSSSKRRIVRGPWPSRKTTARCLPGMWTSPTRASRILRSCSVRQTTRCSKARIFPPSMRASPVRCLTKPTWSSSPISKT